MTSEELAEEKPKPSRRTVALIVTPLILVTILGYVGLAFFPWLVKHHPLWLIATDPRNRQIILVADRVDYFTLLLVAVTRKVIFDPLFYALGRLYGHGGVRWVQEKLGEAGFIVAAVERWFGKAGWFLVFAYPGGLVCTLAGATGMNFALFLTLNVLGTVTMVTAVYAFGEIPIVSDAMGGVSGFIGRYTLPLTIFTISLVILNIAMQSRKGKSKIESVDDAQRELEGMQEEPDPTSPDTP